MISVLELIFDLVDLVVEIWRWFKKKFVRLRK
jgi:hypothetical protein